MTDFLVAWRSRDLCHVRPASRGGHCCACLKHHNSGIQDEEETCTLLIFGGSDPYGVSCNDIYAIHVEERFHHDVPWRCSELQPNNSGSMPHVMGHSAGAVATTAIGGVATRLLSEGEGVALSDFCAESMIVFGGCQQVPDSRLFGDVHVILVHKRWKDLEGTWKAPPLVRSFELSCVGHKPSPRHAHASAIVENGGDTPPYMFIMGGSNEEDRPLGDCFVLNVSTCVWREVKLGRNSLAREMSAMCVFPAFLEGTVEEDTMIMVVGGRDEAGQMCSDTLLFRIAQEKREGEVEHAITLSSTSFCSVAGTTSHLQPVCCHSLIQVAQRAAVCVGGFSHQGPAQDQLLVVSKDSVCATTMTRVGRKADGSMKSDVNFGIGHSSCSWTMRSGRSRCLVVSGLTPHAASGTLEIFEFARR